MRTTDDRTAGPTERSPDLRLAAALDDCLGNWLETRLGGLLGGIDDTLFANAVGAPTREEQDEWFAAMQALRSLQAAFPGQLRACLRGAGGPRSVRASDADPEVQAWQAAFAAVGARAELQHAAALAGLRELIAAWSRRAPRAREHAVDAQRLAAALAQVAHAGRLPACSREVLVKACEDGLFGELDAYYARCVELLHEAGVSVPEAPETPACADTALRDLLPGLQGPERSRRLVELLFRELAGDAALAPRPRALLCSLEPTVLATASADRELFASREHPLHAALADLGTLAASMGPQDALDSDPQFTALAGFARELRLAGAERDAQQRAATRIAHYVAGQAQQARLAQQRTETAEQARLLAATAHAAIEREVQRELGHCRLPVCAEELMREGWRRVLVHAQLAGGTGGAEWQRMLQGLRDFLALWCRGAAWIPEGLADLLREGMLRAGCDPLRSEILLRSAAEELASWDPPAPPPALMQVEEPPEAPPECVDPPALAEADALVRGSWIAFLDAAAESSRARLAMRCGDPQQLVFVDRYGRRARCLGREELAAALATGAARSLPCGDPLARALARLRERLARRAHAA